MKIQTTTNACTSNSHYIENHTAETRRSYFITQRSDTIDFYDFNYKIFFLKTTDDECLRSAALCGPGNHIVSVRFVNGEL